ncbi:Protein of unknown function [Cotesia congregata]|uniref:Uncharacterized protein n=1 Tax=Cotesia congregata TaxID=51543 RepID=A0A8J2HT42_COTCN|nr:Protein of unknown function [Cotesia congregata]
MGLDFLNNIMSSNKQPEMNMPDIIYGSLTNTKDNQIRNKNVNGSISFGSNTVQNNNVYGGQPPYDNSDYSDNSEPDLVFIKNYSLLDTHPTKCFKHITYSGVFINSQHQSHGSILDFLNSIHISQRKIDHHAAAVINVRSNNSFNTNL